MLAKKPQIFLVFDFDCRPIRLANTIKPLPVLLSNKDQFTYTQAQTQPH